MRFPAQSELPDPYDGLIPNQGDELKVHACIGLPLYANERLIGAITIDGFDPQLFDRFTNSELRNLSAIASVSLNNALMIDKLEKLALESQNSDSVMNVSMTDNVEMIGQSANMQALTHEINVVASTDLNVLILGETGTGKELVAKAVHLGSERKKSPLVYLNCAALPESIAESELFGHVKGAFTGAISHRSGKFELADKGTLFLDEIGELPLSAQVRLLRVLQNSTITRVGGYENVQLDIRVIAATHRNLKAMAHKGEFREDLWYRLAIFPIEIPSLRQRRSDIPLLVQHFLELLCAKLNLNKLPRVSPEQLENLNQYQWPGNVRELINVIERAIIQSPEGPLSFDFLHVKQEGEVEIKSGETIVVDPSHASDKLVPLDTMISKYIAHAMRITGGKLYGTGGAAELLDINPNTLKSKMKKLGLC